MSVPQRLSRRLVQALGSEAAEDLVNLLDGVELQRSELRAFREGLRAEFADFRADVQRQNAATQQQMAELSAALATGLEKVKADIQKVRADLLIWSFLFWVAAVGTIAGVAGVFR